MKTQKKSLIIILIVLIIAFVAVLLLPTFTSSLKLKETKSEFKSYFLNDFEFPKITASEENESYYWYNYALVKGSIGSFEEEKLLLPGEYLENYRNVEASFQNECIEENLKECEPYKTLMPYCMLSRTSWLTNEGDIGGFKEEISKNITYSEAVKYWKTYIEREELGESDLSAFLGIVTVEKLCGDLSQNDSENLLEKLLKIEVDENQPIEKILHSLKKKVSLIKALQDPKYFNRFSKHEDLKNSICNKTPNIGEIEEANDVCTVSNYYIVKTFCAGNEPVISSVRDYSLVSKYLNEKYSDLEKVVCQMIIYQLSEK